MKSEVVESLIPMPDPEISNLDVVKIRDFYSLLIEIDKEIKEENHETQAV